MRCDDEANIICSYDDIDCKLCKGEEKFSISKIKKVAGISEHYFNRNESKGILSSR